MIKYQRGAVIRVIYRNKKIKYYDEQKCGIIIE